LRRIALDGAGGDQRFVTRPDRAGGGFRGEGRIVFHAGRLAAWGPQGNAARVIAQRDKASGAPDFARAPCMSPPDERRRAATAPPG